MKIPTSNIQRPEAQKDPTSNIQHPEKLQAPNTEPGLEISSHLSSGNHESGRLLRNRIIGFWHLDVLWMLDVGCWMFLSSLLVLLSAPAFAQDRLKTMPGYE